MAFDSVNPKLVTNDTNGKRDAFVWDHTTRKTERVSVDAAGNQANGPSFRPSLSGDGQLVAFDSTATNLSPNDTNGVADVFVRDRGLIGDGRNDLAIDFGPRGLWLRLNNGTWTKVDNSSPGAIAVGDLDGTFRDELIAAFPGRGLLARYNNVGPWRKLHDSVPTLVATGEFNGNTLGDLAAYFGGVFGLFQRLDDGDDWKSIPPGVVEELQVGDIDGSGRDELVVKLDRGLKAKFNNGSGWVGNFTSEPARMAIGNLNGDEKDDLVLDIEGGVFVLYDSEPHAFLPPRQPAVKILDGITQILATGDLDGNGEDEVLADRGPRGLWAFYNNAAPWVRLDSRSPTSILATDLDGNGKEDLVVGFGGAGVFVRYNNAGAFRLLRAWPAQAIAAGGFD